MGRVDSNGCMVNLLEGRKVKVWIQYDNSRARLPKMIADSAVELARITGATLSTIRSTACRVRSGECINGKYAVVDIGDFEEGGIDNGN